MKRREVFEGVWSLLVGLLKSNQDTTVQSTVLHELSLLVPQFRSVLFSKANSICGELIYQLLRKCNSNITKTRNDAATVYISFIEVIFCPPNIIINALL